MPTFLFLLLSLTFDYSRTPDHQDRIYKYIKEKKKNTHLYTPCQRGNKTTCKYAMHRQFRCHVHVRVPVRVTAAGICKARRRLLSVRRLGGGRRSPGRKFPLFGLRRRQLSQGTHLLQGRGKKKNVSDRFASRRPVLDATISCFSSGSQVLNFF